jgi:hypothetical protein
MVVTENMAAETIVSGEVPGTGVSTEMAEAVSAASEAMSAAAMSAATMSTATVRNQIAPEKRSEETDGIKHRRACRSL